MKKYRDALERFYWAAHSDGELAEFDNNIREHLSSPRWKERREKLIDEVLQKLNLPNKACSGVGVCAPSQALPTPKKLSTRRTLSKPAPTH